MPDQYDVAVIGGGVVGSTIARELGRYRLKTILLEREADVARGTSGKNSGVVHTGINVPTGSLKARYNVAGAEQYEQFCADLDVPYQKCGKLIVALDESQTTDLEALKARGDANGVPDLEIIDGADVKRLEPNIIGAGAVSVPTAAITCPYTLTIALAEAAVENGVDIRLRSEVVGIDRTSERFDISLGDGKSIKSRLIINSAGLYSDRIASMAGVDRWTIYPCRGEYVILDRTKGDLISRMVYPVPPKGGAGLGIHITPSVDGNILLGPSADYTDDPEDVKTTADVRKQLINEAMDFLPAFGPRDVIAAYSGMRPKLISESQGGFADFVVEEVPECPGMMHLVGIESPGLTAAPAIATELADWVLERVPADNNPAFKSTSEAITRFREVEEDVQVRLIEDDADYGEIICRCEMVTRHEILEAMSNPLGATSLNSIKYRSRATMGRCQGGFCGPRIVDLLIENGHDPTSITLNGEGSWLFLGTTEDLRDAAKSSRQKAASK